MTGRRAVLRVLGIAGLLAGASVAALAQRQPTNARVGALLFTSPSDPLAKKYLAVFRQRLRELGYVEGTTIVIDERFAAGSAQRLRELAQELADAKMDVIVTPAVAATVAMHQVTKTSMTEAAHSSRLEVKIVEVSRPEDFVQAYASIRNAGADWLHVLDEPMISSRRTEWVDFAAAARLPLSSDTAETPRIGGLLSYSAVISEHYSLAAVYVDKILRGAKPADLPVEQPTRYELIVNARSAKALGLSVPHSVLLRAQEVLQ